MTASRAKEVGGAILRWAEKGSLGVLIFLAAFGFNTLIGLDRRVTKMEAKDQDDISQWNRLQQQDEKITDLQIQVTVLRELDKLRMELEREHHKIAELRKPVATADDDDDDDDIPPPKPPQMKPPATEALLNKLEELKRRESLQDYRNRHMMEQRTLPRK